ncbi:MAG: type IV pilus modification PilV family protein [Bacillota bacterium]
MKKNNFHDHGFTLLEVVWAMVIIMIVLIPIISFFSGSRERYARSAQVTRAVNLAQEKMEELVSRNPEELCQVSPSWEPFGEYPEYRYRVEVTCTDVELELYKIQVKVIFPVLGNEREIFLATYTYNK